MEELLPHLIWAGVVLTALYFLKQFLGEISQKKFELYEKLENALKKDLAVSIKIEIGGKNVEISTGDSIDADD